MTLEVLAVARLLADQHDLGARRPLAEHRLCRVLVQVASAACPRRLDEGRQRALGRQEVGRGPRRFDASRHLPPHLPSTEAMQTFVGAWGYRSIARRAAP